MKGASMAASPATESGSIKSLLRAATVYQVSGWATAVKSSFIFTSLIPFQKEPKTSHGILFSSIIKLGSIAFHISLPGMD
jgi:hypothetical protein